MYGGLAQYRYHFYYNGTHYGDYTLMSDEAHVDNIMFFSTAGDANLYTYVDAVGYSWDTSYKIGDNCFWKHYAESTDSFEGDDVGTQGTSITWVDVVDTAASVEIVQEFGVHKKILRQYYSSGAGGFDYSYHSTATQAKTGWFSCHMKVSDVTGQSQVILREDATAIVQLQITASKFQHYTLGAYADTGLAAVNDTWYHVYIQWYDAATDTFDVWINNVLYIDGAACQNNQTSGVNRIDTKAFDAAAYMYIDAPICSLDSDIRGDNRLFDYNATYTKEDITDDTINVTTENKFGHWRKGILFSLKEYTKDVLFFQIYDINSKLAMEAEIKTPIWNGATWTYPLLDKNYDDLQNRSSNTFAASKIHDPTDSTCILKTILPTVGQADGRLLLVNADTKTDTYSPVTKNKPDGEMLLVINDIADSCVIVEANGKCHLDDDLASGSSLDLDTAAHCDYMTRPPIVAPIYEGFNYYEIFGAVNPDTGARFHKEVDNTGDDEKHTFRITNNEFKTQTDVDAYAVKVAARTIDMLQVIIYLQSIGTHNMGTTFTYKYVDTEYNIPSAAYYVVSEKMNYDRATSELVLSAGIIETSKYAQAYERPENYTDSFANEIYETDIVKISPIMKAYSGATDEGYCISLDDVGEKVILYFFVEDEIDVDRDLTITLTYQRKDANSDTILFAKTLQYAICDGSETVWTNVWALVADATPADDWNIYNKKIFTVDSGDLVAGALYQFSYNMSEAERTVYFHDASVKYYSKRSLS